MARCILRGAVGVLRLRLAAVAVWLAASAWACALRMPACARRVHILDVARVLGVHFIQFAQPVVDGSVCRLTHILRANGLMRPQNPSFGGLTGCLAGRAAVRPPKGALGCVLGWDCCEADGWVCCAQTGIPTADASTSNCEVARENVESIGSFHWYAPLLVPGALKAAVD